MGQIDVVGCCNGLVCVAVCLNEKWGELLLVLWNPVIQQLRYLPRPKYTSTSNAIGFGFVSESKDYVIVKVGDFPRTCMEVYNMSTDSWKSIDCNLFDASQFIRTIDFDKNSVFLNGSFHWAAWEGNNIVHYNLKDEVVGLIKAVAHEKNSIDFGQRIRAFDISRLAVINEATNKFDIWVMNEYGVQDSWTRQFHIVENIPRCPVGYWNGLVITDDGIEVFHIYNLDTRERQEIPRMEEAKGYNWFF